MENIGRLRICSSDLYIDLYYLQAFETQAFSHHETSRDLLGPNIRQLHYSADPDVSHRRCCDQLGWW